MIVFVKKSLRPRALDEAASPRDGRLAYHAQVHLLITGGGITVDGQRWEPARGQFLVPVFVVSRKIAALFRAALVEPERCAEMKIGQPREHRPVHDQTAIKCHCPRK
jgi:hypothetical protein